MLSGIGNAARMFTIRKKLLLSFGVILTISTLLEVGILLMLDRVNNSYEHLINAQVAVMNQTQDAVIEFEQSALNLRGYMLTGDPNYLLQYQEGVKTVQKSMDSVGRQIKAGVEKNYYQAFGNGLVNYQEYATGAIQIKNETMYMGDQVAGAQEIEKYLNQGKGTVEQVAQAGNAIVAYMNDQLNQGKQQNSRIAASVRNIALIGMILVIVIGLLVVFIIIKTINKPVRALTEQAGQIADGYLRAEAVQVDSRDELMVLARAFNKMSDNIRQLLIDLKDKAVQVANGAQELTSTIQQTSSGIAASASAMHQMAATVEQVAGHTQKVSQVAVQANQYAENGQLAINHIRQQMGQITDSTKLVGQAIKTLNKTSTEVFQIVDLITEIAEQTNLLALNAAIEAAQAGEQGRGFAVVADEVRKLAERSARAAGKIKELIVTVQQESDRAVVATEEEVREVENGNTVVVQVGTALESIIQTVRDLDLQIQEVAVASEHMSQNVSGTVATIQEQTAVLEEISSMADGFAAMAAAMEEMSQVFKVEMKEQ